MIERDFYQINTLKLLFENKGISSLICNWMIILWGFSIHLNEDNYESLIVHFFLDRSINIIMARRYSTIPTDLWIV